MCLSILEVVLLVAGAWLLITGNASDRWFQPLFGKGHYVMPERQARLLGMFLATPLPVAILVSLILRLLLGENYLAYAVGFEIIYDVVVAVVATRIARKSRQPVMQTQQAITNQ